jgi:sialate O-acetylesterase
MRCSVAASALCLGAFGVASASAEIRLPHVIGSHMVLQRDQPLPIWGWARPGEAVVVELASQRVETVADDQGRFKVELGPVPAGGPFEMTVEGDNLIELSDILVGEVWLCAGQSNMEMGVGVVRDGPQEVEAADFPRIRLFDVPKRLAAQTATDVEEEWRACSPETVARGEWGGFSAVAYFFGRKLHEELNVPVGLIDASWGGSSIEPWMPREAFAGTPALQAIEGQIVATDREYRQRLGPALDGLEGWAREMREALAEGRARLPETPELPRHPISETAPRRWPWRPTGLYNGMIHPIVPFAIRGALWYQGESNLADGLLYQEKLAALVSGWRRAFELDELPFFFVQLAPFRYVDEESGQATPFLLPEMWETQRRCLGIPHTGMVVTTDLGDLGDIHPKNKQEVGRRLSLWALAKAYGRAGLTYSGPLFVSVAAEDGRLRVRFDHAGGGLRSSDGEPLRTFEVSGEDGEFFEANAVVDGEDVLVFSELVENPTAVRFAWHQEARPNLENRAQLPASPFRAELPRDVVGVRIDASDVRGPISDKLLGLNLSLDHDTDERWADGRLAERLREVRAGALRYPGGEETSFFHWEHPGAPSGRDVWDTDPNSRHHADLGAADRNASHLDLDELVEWCRRIGAEPVLGINIESGVRLGRVEESLAEAVRLVRHCQSRGYGVKHFHLDNESTNPAPSNYKALSVAEYASQVRAFSLAMKAVDPSIRLIASVMGPPSGPEWRELVRLAGAHFDVADMHWYWNRGTADWTEWLESNPMAFYPWEAEQFREMVSSSGQSIELAMLEWNVGENPRSPRSPLQQALMQAEMLGQIIEGRFSMACLSPLSAPVERGGPSPLVDQETLNVTPTFRLFELYRNALGQRLVWSEANRSQVRPVSALSDDGKALFIYLLHKSGAGQPLRATVDVSGFLARSVEGVALTGESPEASVAEVRPLEVRRPSRSGPLEVTLPPHSLTLVTLRR